MNNTLKCFRRNIGSLISLLSGKFIYKLSLSLYGQKLDLGCGPVKIPGSVGLDKVPLKSVDVICNAECSLPFEDETFDVVYSSNTLEHIQNIEIVMSEVYRVLKKNGHFLIRVPYFASPKAFQDPTHVRFFTFKTFDYFVADQNVAPEWYFRKLFRKIIKKRYVFSRNPFHLFIAPIINLSPGIQSFYENSIFCRLIPPEALEIHIIK